MHTARLRVVATALAVSAAILFGGLACGGSEPDAEEAQAAEPTNTPVTLKNGPAGQLGSRFDDPDVEVNLTAEVFEWEVIDGEPVEVWGFNGQYPGPEIRAKEGDKVRINVTNNLPEDTAVHWHGLEVPNDQDGVPNITQPGIKPGETWTYEFIAPSPGTTMYHTHANTIKQLPKGMFGAFVVEPREGMDEYDRQYTLALHEIEGFYTINGKSFPSTLDTNLLGIRSGEKVLVRMINAGQQHHPMHLHGHQFKVVQLDGSPLENPLMVNTQDIAPGQTVDVEITGDNPGTWVFHCHIIPHVTNHGEYPGGMIAVLDYEDHTSYFESDPPLPANPTATPDASHEGEHEGVEAGPTVDGADEVEVRTFDLGYSTKEIEIKANEWVNFSLINDGALEHDFVIEGTDVRFHVPGSGASDQAAIRILEPGTYTFYCSIPGHRAGGMEGTIVVR